ncbi:hypothetical protein BDZ89DRAFT_1214721 [Hymenopellis radicata]|nr:hypothetical protein BDZ89DRAFT_1214721 [Hymenopellis radicata]
MAPHCSTCCCQSTQIPLDTPELPDAVQAHILSNEPPSTSELLVLHEYGLSIDSYLTRLDAEMAALSATQEKLQKALDLKKTMLDNERRLLKERQQHISGALFPLRRLPLEILQEIFLYTLAQSGEPGYTWFNVRDPTDPLWRIRCVCRKWRLAAQDPRLWAGLRLRRTGQGGLSMLRDVLDHSCSLPLRIHFLWDPESLYLGRLLLDELVQHSERWQYASFICVARFFTQSMSALRGRLPKLEELGFLELCHLSQRDHIEEDAHPFEIAPSLAKADISRAFLKLDGSQLKSFTSDASTPAAFRVLVSSPYLTYLADRSTRAMPNDDSSQNKTRYLHSHLSTLRLQQCAQLNLFTLPTLQHLEAGQIKSVDELHPSLPIISQFLHVSQCPLLSLTIHNCELSIGSVPEILQVVSGLQNLSISINICSIQPGVVASSDEALNVLLHRLAERASNELSSPRLVPTLQSFAFKSRHEYPWRFMDESIVDMIRVRSGMESVCFTIHPQSQLPNLSDDDVACLRTIKNAGFNFSIVKQANDYSEAAVFI